MTTLKCPKCRQRTPDDALDAGQCPACGFPIDGPLVLDAETRRPRALPLLIGGVLVAAVGAAGYTLSRERNLHAPGPQAEVSATNIVPVAPASHLAPFPHLAKPGEPQMSVPVTTPAAEPKKASLRPIGVVMKIDPKIEPTRHFDQPDDTAALPDLNSGDRVVLTGRVRALRIGSVNGKGQLDASGLVVEEIAVTGDLSSNAVVLLASPDGKVTLGGYIAGNAKLAVAAPGGEIVLLANSGRIAGSAAVTVSAKKLDLAGKVLGGAKLDATLTTGGVLKFASIEEGAVVTYQRAVATDPAPTVERGAVRGGGKVLPRE